MRYYLYYNLSGDIVGFNATDGPVSSFAVEVSKEKYLEAVGYIPSGNVNSKEYIPTQEQSSVVLMRSLFATQLPDMNDDTIIQCSGLAEDWTPGNHTQGEIYNTRSGVHADGQEWEQTWECFQAHDNDVYPDIKPGNPAWFTFWRPLHGASPETARPWVAPMGAHDLYKAGEYMVWTDGTVQHCLKDTNFSPAEQPDAWEVYPGQ